MWSSGNEQALVLPSPNLYSLAPWYYCQLESRWAGSLQLKLWNTGCRYNIFLIWCSVGILRIGVELWLEESTELLLFNCSPSLWPDFHNPCGYFTHKICAVVLRIMLLSRKFYCQLPHHLHSIKNQVWSLYSPVLILVCLKFISCCNWNIIITEDIKIVVSCK